MSQSPSPEDREVLERIEEVLRSQKLRGHVYLTEGRAIAFATRQKRSHKPLERNVGPRPVEDAVRQATPAGTEPQEWLQRLGARSGRQGRNPSADDLEHTGPRGDRVHAGAGALRSARARRTEYKEGTAQALAGAAGLRDRNEANELFSNLMQRPAPGPGPNQPRPDRTDEE